MQFQHPKPCHFSTQNHAISAPKTMSFQHPKPCHFSTQNHAISAPKTMPFKAHKIKQFQHLKSNIIYCFFHLCPNVVGSTPDPPPGSQYPSYSLTSRTAPTAPTFQATVRGYVGKAGCHTGQIGNSLSQRQREWGGSDGAERGGSGGVSGVAVAVRAGWQWRRERGGSDGTSGVAVSRVAVTARAGW
jgi:hypothetical protein